MEMMPYEELRDLWAALGSHGTDAFVALLGDVPLEGLRSYHVDVDVEGLSRSMLSRIWHFDQFIILIQ